MTTYNGRSANYIPGKEVPNKEPPVSKFVVEKLYQVHRERLMKVTPTIDSHIHIPDFMKNQSWKKNVMLQQQKSITQHNQEIYRRIAKLEHEESPITKDSRMHVKRIESKAKYIKKLKHDGRVRRIVKIQKENEYFMKRIERVQPMYSLKDTKEWYKHHQNFKAGRYSLRIW